MCCSFTLRVSLLHSVLLQSIVRKILITTGSEPMCGSEMVGEAPSSSVQHQLAWPDRCCGGVPDAQQLFITHPMCLLSHMTTVACSASRLVLCLEAPLNGVVPQTQKLYVEAAGEVQEEESLGWLATPRLQWTSALAMLEKQHRR